jgi:hypothetical protein
MVDFAFALLPGGRPGGGQRTRDLSFVVDLLTTLPLSHSGSP